MIEKLCSKVMIKGKNVGGGAFRNFLKEIHIAYPAYLPWLRIEWQDHPELEGHMPCTNVKVNESKEGANGVGHSPESLFKL